MKVFNFHIILFALWPNCELNLQRQRTRDAHPHLLLIIHLNAMRSKNEANEASTEKKVQKPSLKRALTSEIIAELSRRGIRAEIDYKSALKSLYNKVFLLWEGLKDEIDELESDEQLFNQVADKLDAFLCNFDYNYSVVSNDDCEQALQNADNQLQEVHALAEYNATECEHDYHCDDMNDIASQVGDMLFYIAQHESIDKYLAIEKIAGKVCR